jgi:hypothetical protein
MDGGADGKHGGAARCVVWRAKGSPLPRDLSSALKRPDFQVTECDNQFEAVARLCTSREESGRTVLLVVEPKMLPAMPEVGDVIDRYAPMTTMWVFESQPQPQIRAVTPVDRAQWEKVSKPTTPTPPANPAAVTRIQAPQRTGPVLKTAVRDIAHDAVTTTRLKMPQAPKPPQLRLAGDGPQAVAAAPAVQPEVKVRPVAPAPEVKVRPVPDAQPKPLKPQVRDESDPSSQASSQAPAPKEGPGIQPSVPSVKAGNLLTDEELEMLLAPDDGKGHY